MTCRFLRFTVAAAIAALAGVGRSDAGAAEQVTVKGSDTMILLGQKWAEVYMGKNPGVKIQVTGGGSGTGIAALTVMAKGVVPTMPTGANSLASR